MIKVQIRRKSDYCSTGDHSKQDQISLEKIAEYIGFCAYRRSYFLWSPVIGEVRTANEGDYAEVRIRTDHATSER